MRLTLVLSFIALAGCARFSRPVSVDPDVNFAAHVQHDRIALDRAPGGKRGRIEAPGFHLGAPRFVVSLDGEPVAEVFLTAPAAAEVRQKGAPAPIASVEPGWDDNAIRLTLHAADGSVLKGDVFARTVTGGGPSVLTRIAQSTLDVRGTYRAPLRDAKGHEVGWLRVKVSPYADAARIYDGELPPAVGADLAAAIAVALDSEVDWIENHTLDVYHGQSGGPLRESIPLGR